MDLTQELTNLRQDTIENYAPVLAKHIKRYENAQVRNPNIA